MPDSRSGRSQVAESARTRGSRAFAPEKPHYYYLFSHTIVRARDANRCERQQTIMVTRDRGPVFRFSQDKKQQAHLPAASEPDE